jgi:deoxyribodipyrimidine photo-lyase
MIAARRTTSSHALDHALAHCRTLGRPLVVFEPLRAGYRHASDRLHAFVIDGMADNARAFAKAGITYVPYIEPAPGDGSGLLAALAARACVVVTDEQPGFFLARMVAAAATQLPVRLEIVDGNGVFPLRAADRAFSTAASFRRHLQKHLPPHLLAGPTPKPLTRVAKVARDATVRGATLRTWKSAPITRDALAALPIDHDVAPVADRGGSVAGQAVLADFVARRLARYGERSEPDADSASGLSPYLHFGHVGAYDVFSRVATACDWDPSRLGPVTGSRAGWWGLPEHAEGFLDELITWREVGYGFCFHRRDHDRYGALPVWARATLAKHAADPRPVIYRRSQLVTASTHDPIWNAAQRQLLAEGRIHNYLRMLWGKKILEWSPSPRAALATMIELNNTYAVDGRDPNSYSGILWTLGLFDHAWGPERPIFGTVRYMSSDATRRKLDLDGYLRRWAC